VWEIVFVLNGQAFFAFMVFGFWMFPRRTVTIGVNRDARAMGGNSGPQIWYYFII
jgi:hypothetical protein